MTALVKLVRTTAFKLTAVYLLVFTLFAAFLLGYFSWNTERVLRQQINAAVDAEIANLSEQYSQGGLLRLVGTIERRSRRPSSFLYLVTTPNGESLVGNVGELPGDVLSRSGRTEVPYTRYDEPEAGRTAVVQIFALSGGMKLLVGADLEEQHRVGAIMTNATLWSAALIVILGVAGGWFVTRRVLHRLDDISDTSRSIIEGDLKRRLKVSGTGDEIDRLATTTNAMLDRISELMTGLKHVSDNIAHELKTPLTRLRNQAEDALRKGRPEEEYRRALDMIIDESDGLIRTFNALLMIARVEAGQLAASSSAYDMAELVQGVADLYEPLAEEKGVALKVDVASPLRGYGNRELISQALANLLDNALKHGAEGPAGGTPEITIQALREGGKVRAIISDRGAGIPEAERGRVLERFVRLEASRARPGSGLGLSLVAAVAKLHGGALILEDNKPGLRAIIELPDEPGRT